MKNLRELFEHQLQDLHSAEIQLIEALPKLLEKADDAKLKKAFKDHLEQTKQHKTRLEEISNELDISPDKEKCKAMKGLIKEASEFMQKVKEKDVRDAGIIAEAQRIEHYEISGYGTAVRYAKELGLNDVANTLQKTLDEEYAADDLLTKIAESRLNEKAM